MSAKAVIEVMRERPAPLLRRPRWTMPLLNALERIGRDNDATAHSSRRVKALKLSATVLGVALLVTLSMPWGEVRQRHHSSSFWRRWAGRLLYSLTVINPCFSVAADNYTFLRDAASSLVLTTKREVPSEAEEKLRRLVLGIGAIRPRRVFAAGATLRGLQLHTPLRRVFDPPSYFGATVNILALMDGVTLKQHRTHRSQFQPVRQLRFPYSLPGGVARLVHSRVGGDRVHLDVGRAFAA